MACCLGAGSCHKSSGIDAALVTRSNDLTNSAVGDALGGNQSFAVAKGKLAEALATNPNNQDARLFLALVSALDQLEQSAAKPGGQMQQMLGRMGMQNAATTGSLWDLSLQAENHGQGMFKDTFPDLGEVHSYFHGTMRPALDAVVKALTSLPPSYEYVIPAAKGGRLLALISPTTPTDLRLDYGDLQLAAAVLNGLLTGADLLGVLDWASLQPNDIDTGDNPAIDVLEVLRTAYPTFGRILNQGNLAQARERIKATWQCYQNASAHLRNENQVQQQQGLLTLGRDTFAGEPERQQFLVVEARLRTMVSRFVDALDRDEAVAVDVNPLTGDPLPATSQIRLNSHRLFQGVDPRLLYFLTVVNPFTQKTELGITDLAQLTTAMATCGGYVVSIGGAAPTSGDLQELVYSMRIDAPPVSTKVIDGNFADWQANAVAVSDTPAAYIGQPAPDLGTMWVAVDASYLYVHLDQDLTPFLIGTSDDYRIDFEGPNGTAGVNWQNGSGYQPWSSSGPVPELMANAGGIEVRFPIGTGGVGQWAQLGIHAEADNASFQFRSDRDRIYVKVR